MPSRPGRLLDVKGLRTYFHTSSGVIRAVDGVDLAVDPGRTVAIVGESGSGKSVTAMSIMRLIDRPGRVEAGSHIYFNELDLTALSDRSMEDIRGKDISMVYQEPMTSLNPVYTVGDQIAEALRQHERVTRKEAKDRAVEMLALVGVPDPRQRANGYPHQMSGGMRQRVMIAMALVCRPRLLIADEPTTALDVTIQAQILELLKRLREELSMSMLLITHDLGVVADMADDVCVMYAGRIVEEGATRAIFRNPQHPYTEALLSSIPVVGMRRDRPLAVIPGVVPNPLRWPPGCRFAPRCQYVFDPCHTEYPPDTETQGHTAACWLRVPGMSDARSVETPA